MKQVRVVDTSGTFFLSKSKGMLGYAGLKSPVSRDETIISITSGRPKRLVWMDYWIYYIEEKLNPVDHTRFMRLSCRKD